MDGAIDDVFKLIRGVYGEIPVEAAPWLKQTLESFVTALADGVVNADAERRQRAHVGGRAGPPFARSKALRRLELELGALVLRAQYKTLTPRPLPSSAAGGMDIFVCHASEDKDGAARPLAEALRARGYSVWLDESEIKVGDSLLDKIDDGLTHCRFGVVVLSQSYLDKRGWNRLELAGLIARQIAEERPIVLPLWVDIDQKTVAAHLPILAGIMAARLSDGLDKAVADICAASGPPQAR